MRTKATLAIFLLGAVSILPAVAFGSDANRSRHCGATPLPGTVPVGAEANGLMSITAAVTRRVAAVVDDGTVVLVDLETESQELVQLDDSVKIRARSKKDFQGRKKLGLADLREGQIVKVTLYVADGSIRSITVLENA